MSRSTLPEEPRMRGFKMMRTERVGGLTALAVVLSATVSWADAAPNHVRDVKVHPAEGISGGTEIEVIGTGTPSFSVRVAEGGTKLFVDLANADVVGAPEAITKVEGSVAGVLTQGFKTDAGATARLTVSLTHHASYRLKADGATLRLILVPGETTTSADPSPSVAPAVTTKMPAATAAAAGASLEDVRFERKGNKDRILIALSEIPTYVTAPGDEGRLRLELRATKLASPSVARALDVRAFKGSLQSVATFADEASGTSIVEIDRGDGAAAQVGQAEQGTLSVEGKTLVWSFDRPATAPGGGHSLAASRSKTLRGEAPLLPEPKIETSIRGEDGSVETVGGGEAGFLSHVRGQEGGRYSGRRIGLDLKDADIHNILRLLADVGHVNVVTADDVGGTVTIRMNDVPWDQALDVVLSAKGLGMVRTGNLIRVAPLDKLQKERELRVAQQRSDLDLQPLEMRLIPISYATAQELSARAKDLLSPRGSITVDERTNTLIVRDVTGNVSRIEELTRLLDTQTPEVLIEARIVEATSNYLRDVGIQWGGDTTFSEATGNPTGLAFPSRVSAAGGASDGNTPTAGLSPFANSVSNPNFAVNLPAAVGTGQGGALGLAFGSIDNNFNLNLRLSAAETSGLVRIVSSPRVLTLNNKEARINQGTLIPFSQVSAQGVQTTFQEAKLQLLVKPHVTADGSVAMHMKVNRDEPNFNQTAANGAPTILKREAETDLLVMDGHTAVIGGIYTRNTGRSVAQVPFFGDIPILGILFQHRTANDTRNELVVFITPRIVNRAETSISR
jgi:type IV pilus assembly protein PilQ